MERVLPLLLTGCIYQTVPSLEIGGTEELLLRETADLSYVMNGRVNYSRRDGNLFQIEGTDGLGYYRYAGDFKISPSSNQDIVTYTFDGETLRFVSKVDGCREVYTFNLENRDFSRVSIGPGCELFGDLDDKIRERGSLAFILMDPAEKVRVQQRADELMRLEVQMADLFSD